MHNICIYLYVYILNMERCFMWVFGRSLQRSPAVRNELGGFDRSWRPQEQGNCHYGTALRSDSVRRSLGELYHNVTHYTGTATTSREIMVYRGEASEISNDLPTDFLENLPNQSCKGLINQNQTEDVTKPWWLLSARAYVSLSVFSRYSLVVTTIIYHSLRSMILHV